LKSVRVVAAARRYGRTKWTQAQFVEMLDRALRRAPRASRATRAPSGVYLSALVKATSGSYE
jgi:hypothetical protein